MQMKDTVEMMCSADYKERFKAEYYQTKIRYEKLKAFNNKISAAEITCGMKYDSPVYQAETKTKLVEMPKHDCPAWQLRDQQRIMADYLQILEVRAVIEDIEL